MAKHFDSMSNKVGKGGKSGFPKNSKKVKPTKVIKDQSAKKAQPGKISKAFKKHGSLHGKAH